MFDEEGKVIFGTRQPNSLPSDSTLQIQCRDGTTVINVFYVQHAVSTTASNITLQIKSLDGNAVFGVSNFEVFYGSCHKKCKTCSGPT